MIPTCTTEEWVKLGAVFISFFFYSLAEFYLGKKNKGSAIQVLINSVKKITGDKKKKRN